MVNGPPDMAAAPTGTTATLRRLCLLFLCWSLLCTDSEEQAWENPGPIVSDCTASGKTLQFPICVLIFRKGSLNSCLPGIFKED